MAEDTLKETLSKFGSVIKGRRHQLGISQEELADWCGLHRTYITDIERGARNATMDSILKLARALDTSLADLFTKMEKLKPGGYPVSKPVGREIDSHLGNTVHILLVEDNPKHVELTLYALGKNGISNRVTIAHSGEEALDFLLGPKEKDPPMNPDLILLDISLPKMSGLDVLRKIRADARTNSIPVVMLTASRSDQDLKESAKYGVKAFITKPVEFIEFTNIVSKLGFRMYLVR